MASFRGKKRGPKLRGGICQGLRQVCSGDLLEYLPAEWATLQGFVMCVCLLWQAWHRNGICGFENPWGEWSCRGTVTQSWGITTKCTPSVTLKPIHTAASQLNWGCFAAASLPLSRCLAVTGEGHTTVSAKWNNTVTLRLPLTIASVSPSPGGMSVTFPVGRRETQQQMFFFWFFFFSRQFDLCYIFLKRDVFSLFPLH